MSHGIMEHDRGFVFGTTWHNLPQYVQLERAVLLSEAEFCFDYELEKVSLTWKDASGNEIDTGCFGLIRKDTNTFLTYGSAIGGRFTVESNLEMLNRINEHILTKYPDLIIESVGTLFNGQTSFLSLKVDTHQIKGDKSPTVTNLLYCNPLGKGSYLAYAHSTRVVCNNTLNMSKAQGKANQSFRKFSHTKNAGKKIVDHMIDLSETFLGIQEHKEAMNYLAGIKVEQADIDKFYEEFFPINEETKKRGITVANKARDEFYSIFDSQSESMEDSIAHSKYGLLQAYTDYIDHPTSTHKGTDEASIRWDSITGVRASKKEKALSYLLNV